MGPGPRRRDHLERGLTLIPLPALAFSLLPSLIGSAFPPSSFGPILNFNFCLFPFDHSFRVSVKVSSWVPDTL